MHESVRYGTQSTGMPTFVNVVGAALVVIAAVVILAKVLTRVHVMSLFVATHNLLKEKGADARAALRGAINNFRYRSPFSELSDNDASMLVEALLELNHPADVGGLLFQACEQKPRKLAGLRESAALARWAMLEDSRLTIMDLIDEAKVAQRTVGDNRGDDLLDGIVIALCRRTGWKLTGQTAEGTPIFQYRGKDVRLPHVTSGKAIVKTILRVELDGSTTPCMASPLHRARMEVASDFDGFFDACFQSLRRPRV